MKKLFRRLFKKRDEKALTEIVDWFESRRRLISEAIDELRLDGSKESKMEIRKLIEDQVNLEMDYLAIRVILETNGYDICED